MAWREEQQGAECAPPTFQGVKGGRGKEGGRVNNGGAKDSINPNMYREVELMKLKNS